MKKILIKEISKRNKVKHYEIKYLSLKYLLLNKRLKFFIRRRVQYLLNRLVHFHKSKVFLNNLCVLTSRSRSVYRKFRISRIVLRKYTSKGDIVGYRKVNN